MTHDEFWKLIEKAKKKCDGDPDEMVDVLRSALVKLAADEIVSFDCIYDEYRFKAYRRDLWGAAFLLNGGCSDDGFEYFRGWLISQGKAIYDAALENPDSLARFVDPDVDDYELEALMHAPSEAYEEKTGETMPSRDHGYPELTGAEWDEADLDGLFPRIAAKLERD